MEHTSTNINPGDEPFNKDNFAEGIKYFLLQKSKESKVEIVKIIKSDMFSWLLGKKAEVELTEEYAKYLKAIGPKYHVWNPQSQYSQVTAEAEEIQEIADKIVAKKAKKASDPKTTSEVVMELESLILATQTPEARKEICDAFNKNKKWYEQ